MSENQIIVNCCAECTCTDPHKSAPVGVVEETQYVSDERYITEKPVTCCAECTCETPHRSKPID